MPKPTWYNSLLKCADNRKTIQSPFVHT